MTHVMKRRLSLGLVCGLLIAAAGPALAGKSVLRIRLNGPVIEAPTPGAEFAKLFGGGDVQTLYELTKKIRDAAGDQDIHGMALIIEQPQIGLAQAEEVVQALAAFRAAGKPIHCFIDYAGNLGYAVAANTDHVTLAEYSTLDIAGIGIEVSFYKNMFEKIGVSAEMLHCGDYKSAYEPYVHTEPSKPMRENLDWLLDGLYEHWIGMIASGRKLTPEQVRGHVDDAPIWADAAKSAKLVDEVGTFDDFRQRLRKEFGQDMEIVKRYPRSRSSQFDLDATDPFTMIAQMQELMSEIFGGAKKEAKPGVAIVYVDGPIMIGESDNSPFSSGSTAGSSTVRAALQQAAEDSRVKAIVLRVSSPGGSALASDIIWNAAVEASKTKPLVVSMGGVAGSGGYYVALPGDRIFADGGTITASIGVVGGKIVWRDLWEEKIGVTTTEFGRGKRALLMSMNTPWSEDQRQVVQSWMDDVYEQFKGRVTQSRGDRLKGDLEDMAGGRVFTGRQALERGLVDEIGTLHDALVYAAKKVDLSDPPVYVFPEKRDVFEEMIADLLKQDRRDAFEIALGIGGPQGLLSSLRPMVERLAPEKAARVLRDLRNLGVIHRERIGMFMPIGPVMGN